MTTEKPAGPPQSELLCLLADEMFTLGQSDEGEPFAVSRNLPGVTISLRPRGKFRSTLASAYRERHGRPPGSGALTDAIAVLTGDAHDLPRSPVSLRVARIAHALVIDLGIEGDSRCVVIEPGAWRVADQPPDGVLFRRTALTGALPIPRAPGSGDLQPLYELVNLAEGDQPLVTAAMVAALEPGIPHPLLALTGEQGTAKTTTAKLVVRTVDPSPVDLRSASRTVEEWAVAASGSWVVGLDNLSALPDWFQDALCRAATGDGLVRRELYSDSDLAVLSYRRWVILTGIDLGATRGDLADRALMVHPERIPTAHRRLDADIEAEFVRHWPTITAGLYDLTAQVLEVIDDIHLPQPPRMADFARIVAAVDKVTGSDGLSRYARQASDLTAEVLDADLVAVALRSFMSSRTAWTGSATELLDELDRPTPTPKSWPSTPAYLSGRLRRTAPALRDIGIRVDLGRNSSGSTITITVISDADDGNDAVSPTPSVPPQEEEREGEEEQEGTSASSASLASLTAPPPDEEPMDDLPDHKLDDAPPPERIPDHILAQWELEDTAPEEDAA